LDILKSQNKVVKSTKSWGLLLTLSGFSMSQEQTFVLTNENTNGLIRQYFPKGTNFKDITKKDFALVVEKLNRRPRKCLNYQTPHEAFYSAIRGALAA
jgi:hypothetical protein